MNGYEALDLAREALLQALLLAGPPLVAALLVGVLTGLVQSLFQINDQAVSSVPKIFAVTATLVACLPWMFQRLAGLTEVFIRG